MAYELKDTSGNPLKKDGRPIYAFDLIGSKSLIKGVDLKARTLSMIGTDETRDRDGDIIRMAGWQIENYLKNPVFLWAHDYRSVPLGATSKLVRKRTPRPHMLFNVGFPPEGLNPFADMILQLYAGKFINASSVGFIPIEHERTNPEDLSEEEKKKHPYGCLNFLKQELLELSGCAVPSNPSALQNAVDAVKGQKFAGVPGVELAKALQGHPIPEIEKSDDVLGELSKLAKDVEYSEEDETVQVQVPHQIAQIEVDETDGEEEFHTVASEEEESKEEEGLEKIEGLPEGAEEISKDAVTKPLPNEHRCRLKNPDQYDRFARKNCAQKHDDKCIDVIYGIKEGKSEIQTLAYKKETWTAGSARSHCKSREGTFEAASGSSMDDVELDAVYEELNSFRQDLGELKSCIKTLTECLEKSDSADNGPSNPADRYEALLSQKGNENGGRRNTRKRKLRSWTKTLREVASQLDRQN